MANQNNDKDTRQKILDAATSVFSKKGYHDTKVDEIVQESQTSKGAVYFHFPSKQQIFLALVDQFAGLLEKKLMEAIDVHGGGVAGVNAALEVGLETFSKYRGLAKIFLIQAVGLGSAFEEKRVEIMTRYSNVIKHYLEQAVESGDIGPIDVEVVSFAWIGAINEVVIRWVHTGEPDLERVLPTMRFILLRSVGIPDDRIAGLD